MGGQAAVKNKIKLILEMSVRKTSSKSLQTKCSVAAKVYKLFVPYINRKHLQLIFHSHLLWGMKQLTDTEL